MSNKGAGSKRKKKTSSRLVPRLRFPEFRNAGDWEARSLKEIGEFVGERIPVSQVTHENYVSTENLLPDYHGLTRACSLPSAGSVVRYRGNDILAANIRPYLKKIWHADRSGGASNDVIVIRANGDVSHLYLSHVLKNDGFVSYVMEGAKGLKMPRGDLSLIREYPVPVAQHSEQQKIADCLSSLDELISAHGQKLDALKAHKTGLMQQIFPREGENVPRLRFSEFRKDDAWIEVAAGQLFSNRTERGNSSLPIYSVTMTDGLVPRASLNRRIDDISEADANKAVRKGDIAYNMMRMWQGALGVAAEDCMVSPAYIVLEPQGVNPVFFGFMFKLPKTLQILTAHSRGLTEDRLRLYYDDFAKVPLLCPSRREQERIADCLSSIDELITAQSQKLDVLKTHRKGLMQQLFPVLKGANA